MKHCYSFARLRSPRAGLFFLLMLTALGAWAQPAKLYYTQGSMTATLDAAKAVNPDGTAGATLASAATSFAQPTDIVVDNANGFVYVADQYVGTGGILRFTTAGTGRTVLVPATAGATYNGLALDAANSRLYFTQGSATDPTLDALKVVSLTTGNTVTTLASGAANFSQPTDLALDAAGGVLYVADQFTGSGTILRFTTAGTGRTVIVPATTNANYNGLALDVAGNRLFFTQGSATATLDALKVVSLSTGFAVTTLASGATNFTQPTDLAYDAATSQLYVTDQYVGTGAILRYTSAGASRTVLVPATAGTTYNGVAFATAINVAPVVTASSGNTTFTQSLPGPSTPVAIDGAVTVTDVDNTTLASATVSISGNFQTGQDVLAFSNTSATTFGNIASATSSTGTLTLTSSGAIATVAQWQAALRAVTYTNTASAPVITNRTVSFVVNDGTVNSNTATKTIVLTRAAVVITSVSVPANGTYRTSQALAFVVNFNTNVTVSGTPTLPLTLDTGGNVGAAYQSGSGTSALTFSYTVISGNFDATGIVLGTALALNGGTIRDAAAQDAVLTLNNVSTTTGVLVDGVAPTVVLSSATVANGGSTTTTPVTFTAQFSESVGSTFAANDITLSSGSTVGTFTANSSPLYSYTFTVTPAVGTVTVSIAAGVAQDAAGNNNTAASSYSFAYALPTVAPTVTTDAPGSITGTSAVLGGNVTASGGATVTERGIVYVAGSGTPTTTDTKVPIGSSTGPFSQAVTGLRGNTLYTVRAYALNSVGTSYGASHSFTTPNNPPTANPDAATVAEDISPTVIPVLGNDNTLPDGGETLIITSTTQPANGTVTINSGTTVSFAPALNFNGQTTFNYTIADGNGGTATATVTVTVTSVNDAPVVTTTAGNTTFTQGAGAVAVDNGLTVTDVDNTTLLSATVSIGTGFVSSQDALSFVPVSGVSGTYTFATGTLAIAGTATVAQYQTMLRSVTYNNTSATPNNATRTLNFTVNDGSLTSAVATKNVSFSATTTVVSITANGSSPTNASTVAYTVTFANAVTGVSASNFSTITSNLTGFSVAPVTGSGTTYVVTVNTGTLTNPGLPGSVQIQFNNSTGVSPVVTNTGFNSPTYTIDRTSPTATISSTAGVSGGTTTTTPIPFAVAFSESVTGFSATSITVGNGTVNAGSFSTSGNSYSFTVMPTTPGTATTVAVAANAAQDAAGNGNPATGTFSLTYIAPITATTWTGTTSTDWFTASNWTGGVPTTAVDAIIPGTVARYPLISTGNAATRALTLNSNATLTMTGGVLNTEGDLTNNGSFVANGGTVVLGIATTANPNIVIVLSPNILGSSTTRFWNLTVPTNGVLLSTSAGAAVRKVLTLNGTFNTQGNPFTLLSSYTAGQEADALVVNNGGEVVGNASVQRAIDPSLNNGVGYRHYSAPVSGSTVADLATSGFAPVVNPAYNASATPYATVPFPTVFGYDEQRVTRANNISGFDKGYFSPASLSEGLAVGRGYTVNIDASQTVDFVGPLNNGILTLGLTNTRATDAAGGWQLLGNPYPAPLNYSQMAASDRVNLEGAVYVFSSTAQYNGQYRTYNNGVGSSPIIPVGQGFFVRTQDNASAGSITFRNSQRLTSPSPVTFQRTAETRPLVQLILRNAAGTLADDAHLYFEQGATAGFEPAFDAVKLPNATGLNLASVLGGRQLAINGLPLGASTITVPLFIGLPATGTYTLHAAELLNFAPGAQPFLRDLQLGTLTDLSLQPTYTFTMNAANTTPRFELVFGRQVLATAPATLAAQVAVFPNPASKAVFIELPESLRRQAVTAALVDALGRTVRTQDLPVGLATHTLPLTQLATGVYALRLQTEAGLIVKKLVIE